LLPRGGVGRPVDEVFALNHAGGFVVARWTSPEVPDDDGHNVPQYWAGEAWQRYDPDTGSAPTGIPVFPTHEAASAAYHASSHIRPSPST
jgi:hypothetical protein